MKILKKIAFCFILMAAFVSQLSFAQAVTSQDKSVSQSQVCVIKKADSEIVVIAKFIAKEGKEDELLCALHSLIAKTIQEKGCLRYELNQNIDNPRIITFVEKYKSMEDFKSHVNKDYIVNYFKNVEPKLVESKDITLHKEILP